MRYLSNNELRKEIMKKKYKTLFFKITGPLFWYVRSVTRESKIDAIKVSLAKLYNEHFYYTISVHNKKTDYWTPMF